MDKKTLFKNIALLGAAVGLLGCLILLGVFAWYSRGLPDPDALLDRTIAQATKIYDRSGEHLLYEIYGEENRTIVKMQEGFCKDDDQFETDPQGIPLFVAQAVLAAEDRAFCSHNGFTFKGVFRAVIFMGKRGGGSTLTQQLVKNAILTNEQHISRKIKELMLSVVLEQKYSKDDILQIYFNEIPYGSTYYGIQTAAQNFYGKNVHELTLAEGATLAGLPQLPTYYINNPDALKERRDWILTSMAELGYITEEAANAAKAEETPLQISSEGAFLAPHFVMWIKGMLEEQYGTSAVETGGLRVITTLDYDKQVIAEEAVKNGVATYGPSYDFQNAGLLAQNPRTGEILAMVGSPDFSNNEIDGQVNVTLRNLQPGSSIKPIVYAAAFERGFTPNTVVWDVNTTFPTETSPYTPYNYDLSQRGLISLRSALQGSLNIPAVKVLYLVGIDHAIAFAQRLGYSTFTDRSRIGLSMVLGGAEVTMLDHVGAYSILANNGYRHTPQALLRVEDSSGKELFSFDADQAKGEQVLDANISAMMSNVLSDNSARAYVFGPSNYLTLSDRPVAAKTGTTNNFKDAWTVGYTPSLTAGVWVGNASGTVMKSGADGSKIAAPIWNEFMKRSLQGTPAESFPTPSIPLTGKAMIDGKVEATTVTIDRASGKLATDRTPESFKETLSCGEFHTILRYVDPRDPLGPAPREPQSDPQYTAWETAVQNFITGYNERLQPDQAPMENCTVPTEEDDVHIKRNEPSIRITSPDNNDDVERTINVRYESEVKRSFGRVEFFIDGTLIDTSSSMDGALLSLPSWVTKGRHTLTVTIYDDVDNSASDEISIRVEDEGIEGSVTITNPFEGQTITRSSELSTYTVVVEIPSNTVLTTLTLYATENATRTTTPIASYVAPSAIVSSSWILPPNSGSYTLSARGTLADGSSIDARSVMVYVN
jgi:membrane peptidoglycan carboxypeptidase